MRFEQSLVALISALSFAPAAHATVNIPNGGYTVTNLEDGSAIWTSVTDPSLKPIKVTPEEAPRALNTRSAKFAKRRTDCWGNNLDRTGTDNAVNALRAWAGTGTTLSSGSGPHHFGFNNNGVYVYYCITRPNTSGNLDLNDVNFALSEMDRNCPPYTASWYGWDGSSELVGKAVSGSQVCTGPFN